jgi:very-short-patch-repair endonuclease
MTRLTLGSCIMQTELEDELYWQIVEAMLPEPERDVVYLKNRRFRADFLWRKQKIVAEVQGGTYQHMGHSTGKGLERDYTKCDLSMLNGYRYFQFSKKMIEDGFAIDCLTKAFQNGEEQNAKNN